ncbi:MAG: hypothetical protein MJE68_25970 [Proteobacteria bacterium]|nr:hypothetical protein [Pseudomonadota bacterium]
MHNIIATILGQDNKKERKRERETILITIRLCKLAHTYLAQCSGLQTR